MERRILVSLSQLHWSRCASCAVSPLSPVLGSPLDILLASPHQQQERHGRVHNAGIVSTSASVQVRAMRTGSPQSFASAAPARHTQASTPQELEEDSEEVFVPPRTPRFVSINAKSRLPPVAAERHPIFFPDITLEMLKPQDKVLKEIKEKGWTREVAFKTTPNVTKLEIKGYLEAVYGMSVERVSTINYLGRRYVAPSLRPGKNVPLEKYRADDWKKAYVIFSPPEGMELATPKPAATPQEMLDIVRAVKGVGDRKVLHSVPARSGEEGKKDDLVKTD